jgi:hypothetical protein
VSGVGTSAGLAAGPEMCTRVMIGPSRSNTHKLDNNGFGRPTKAGNGIASSCSHFNSSHDCESPRTWLMTMSRF